MRRVIEGYAISDKGAVRPQNEDNFILGHCLNENQGDHVESSFCSGEDVWMCAAVFDGMGGVEGGEIASYKAAQTFQECSFECQSKESGEEMDLLIFKKFSLANNAIVEARQEVSVCGTTATVMVTDGNKLKVYHRGDSRAYMKRGNSLYCLTKDHTLAQLKLDVGIYHDIHEAPEKEHHQLTEYLGLEMEKEVQNPYETKWIETQKDDLLLLCSDGLYDMCSDGAILDILAQGNSLKDKANALFHQAMKNGGIDNVTILLVRVE